MSELSLLKLHVAACSRRCQPNSGPTVNGPTETLVNGEPQQAVNVDQLSHGMTGTSPNLVPADFAVKTHRLASWMTDTDSGGYFPRRRPRMMSLTAQAFIAFQAKWKVVFSGQSKATEETKDIVLSAWEDYDESRVDNIHLQANNPPPFSLLTSATGSTLSESINGPQYFH